MHGWSPEPCIQSMAACFISLVMSAHWPRYAAWYSLVGFLSCNSWSCMQYAYDHSLVDTPRKINDFKVKQWFDWISTFIEISLLLLLSHEMQFAVVSLVTHSDNAIVFWFITFDEYTTLSHEWQPISTNRQSQSPLLTWSEARELNLYLITYVLIPNCTETIVKLWLWLYHYNTLS